MYTHTSYKLLKDFNDIKGNDVAYFIYFLLRFISWRHFPPPHHRFREFYF